MPDNLPRVATPATKRSSVSFERHSKLRFDYACDHPGQALAEFASFGYEIASALFMLCSAHCLVLTVDRCKRRRASHPWRGIGIFSLAPARASLPGRSDLKALPLFLPYRHRPSQHDRHGWRKCRECRSISWPLTAFGRVR